MSDAPDLELAPLLVLVAQSFALLQSLALGLTPDRPDPAGTVNRVVQGVTIHPWNGAGATCSSALTAAGPRPPTRSSTREGGCARATSAPASITWRTGSMPRARG